MTLKHLNNINTTFLMHHFVQFTPSNASPPTETVSLLPAPQSLLELGGRNSNLEDPLPCPQLVLSSRQSLCTTFPFSPVSKLMSKASHSTPPLPFPGGVPLCTPNLCFDPNTVSDSELSFCTLFQDYNNIPNFESSHKTFSFPKLSPTAASLPLETDEPHKRKIPP